MLEAVGGCLLIALPILLSSFAEEQELLVQEQVPLHGLEAGEVLDFGMAFLVFCPHVERALHKQPSQVSEVALQMSKFISHVSYSHEIHLILAILMNNYLPHIL